MHLQGIVYALAALILFTEANVFTVQDRVPATLGEKLQLRCSKILPSYWHSPNSYMHSWNRNGQLLNTTDGAEADYKMETSLTYGYCDIVAGTVELLKEMNVTIDSVEEAGHARRKLRCISSVLTIGKVADSDLGEYQCNMSRRYYGSDTGSVTVFKAASEIPKPPRIAYFEKALDRGILSKVLLQCVVENGPVYWYVQLTENMPSHQTVEEFSKADFWRCFKNFRSQSHTIGNITESFAYFDKVCRFDEIAVYCGADIQKEILSKAKLLSEQDISYNDAEYYAYWEFGDSLNVHMGVVIPTIVILFSALAAILACCRGGLCMPCDFSCCTGGNSQSYNQVPAVNFVAADNSIRPSG